MQVYCQMEARRNGPDWPFPCPHSSSLIYSLSAFCTAFTTRFSISSARMAAWMPPNGLRGSHCGAAAFEVLSCGRDRVRWPVPLVGLS